MTEGSNPSGLAKHIGDFMHFTKDKGDLGVFKVMSRLSELGFIVLQPLTEHAPFDIVAYKDSSFYRIQVKYRTKNKFGSVEVKLSTSWADKHGNHTRYYDLSELDVFAVYCPDSDECYFIKTSELKGLHSAFCLRLDNPRNPVESVIRYARDYKTL